MKLLTIDVGDLEMTFPSFGMVFAFPVQERSNYFRKQRLLEQHEVLNEVVNIRAEQRISRLLYFELQQLY